MESTKVENPITFENLCDSNGSNKREASYKLPAFCMYIYGCTYDLFCSKANNTVLIVLRVIVLFSLMARQVDRPTWIAMEGVALIEDSFGRPGRSGRVLPKTQVRRNHHHQYQHPQTLIYHGPQISTVRMPVVTSNEVAQYYGTKVNEPLIVSYAVAQYYDGLVKEPVITSDEAAEYYGGVAIVEHGRKKPFRAAY